MRFDQYVLIDGKTVNLPEFASRAPVWEAGFTAT